MGIEVEEEEVVVVGAGIAGLATALALKRVGVRTLVLERSHDLRATGGGILLFSNAWLALEALGVAQNLSSIYSPLNRRYVTNGSGQVVSSREGAEGQVVSSEERNVVGPRLVHRKALLEALAQELPADTICFSSKLCSIETCTLQGSPVQILHMEDETIIKTKVLIGCDGTHSTVATWLGLSKPIHSGRFAMRGLAVMPQGHGLNNGSHQFSQDGYKTGVGPLNDKEAHWFVTYNSSIKEEEEMRTEDLGMMKKKILENLVNFPPMFLEYIQHSDPTTLTWAPLMFRPPWDLIFGHASLGTVTVAGDAMHAMTPDLGQGGCSALEDAIVIGRHIGNSYLKHNRIVPAEVAEALKLYVKERRWRVISLITASYLVGRVQQGGSGWLRSFVRDKIFYKFLYRRIIVSATNYDCGKLLCVSSSMGVNSHNKEE